MAMKAAARYLRVPPQKARLVADMVRGKLAFEARGVLLLTKNKSAKMISKLIKSAVANAGSDMRVTENELVIKTICVNPGPVIKRFTARAQGRGTQVNHRTSHIEIELAEKRS